MDHNWLSKQVLSNTEQWDKSLTTFYPSSKEWMSDPISYFNHITKVCNYLNAVKLLNWDNYISNNSLVLDVGCGGGWLTGYLSKHPKIKKLIAIDSSANYLDNFLPSVVSQLEGDMSKVETVQGLFTPILLDDNSVDLIVISSAVHHADSLSSILTEFNRVLKPNSYLIILNETQLKGNKYLISMSKAFIKMFYASLFRKYSPFVQKISAAGILYDPFLGDVDYPEWYWKKAISSSGFNLEDVYDSKLSTVSGLKGRSLKHFVCKKI